MNRLKLGDIVSKFSGGPHEDLEQWFDKLTVSVELMLEGETGVDVSKKLTKLMPLFLDGAAYATWKQLSTSQKESLEEIKNALRRVFGKTKAAAWREVKSVKLLPGESVDVMADQIQTLLGIITDGDVPEQMVSTFLLDALPGEISAQVIMQCGEDMELRPIISCAKSLLINFKDKAVGASAMHGRSGTFTDGGHSSWSSRARCEGCRRFGHQQRNCQTICYKCNKKGHMQRDCMVASGNDKAEAVLPDRAAPATTH